MSARRSRLLVWVVLAAVLPLPLFGLQYAVVPAARALMLGAICLLVVAVESADGVVVQLAAVFLVQALLQLALLWALAYGFVRSLARLPGRWRIAVVATVVSVAVVVGSSVELYRTPYRADSIHASLLEVFE